MYSSQHVTMRQVVSMQIAIFQKKREKKSGFFFFETFNKMSQNIYILICGSLTWKIVWEPLILTVTSSVLDVCNSSQQI